MALLMPMKFSNDPREKGISNFLYPAYWLSVVALRPHTHTSRLKAPIFDLQEETVLVTAIYNDLGTCVCPVTVILDVAPTAQSKLQFYPSHDSYHSYSSLPHYPSLLILSIRLAMFRVSNTLVGAVNILTLLLGVVSIGFSIFIHVRGGQASDCQKVLQLPLLVGGVFITVLSVLGIAGSLCRLNLLLYVYLFVTFCLIIALIAFTIFVLLITNQKVGQKVSGQGYKEYKTWDFHNYLQRYVLNDKNWAEIKSCLMDTHVCRNLAVAGKSLIYKQLTTMQTGCCKPPAACGFTMINVTYWEAPKAGAAATDADCNTWSNEEDKLCYDCNSCKGGVLANIRKQWRRVAIINTCVLLVLIVIYFLGCCAITNNRSDRHRSKCLAP
ncbi:tetraspanin-11-like [Prosopis cineraria]|uniref:tetraspanin-11-like n=1 Tax=Prosopis cineraria TaxID=364024 RepID=UPI00240F560C|nr:tetraspanin-11-like [Prosopis cineraria]